MMIDAHQHFWRPARGDYGWLTPALGSIHRDFEEEDLAPHLARHEIARTILVQAAPSEAETDYLLAIARRAPFVAGVVGWVDFEAPDAAERIVARSGDPVIKGLRPMVQDIADDAWLVREDLAPAFRAMVAGGLRFDALVKPRHLGALTTLARRHPDLSIVIDHAAKPDIASWVPGDAAFEAWRTDLAALAGLGCFVKLSALVTEAKPDWRAEDLKPYFDVLLRTFGPERMIWGSDWPVVELAGGYDAWRAATIALTQDLDQASRAAVLGGSARLFYGLGDPA